MVKAEIAFSTETRWRADVYGLLALGYHQAPGTAYIARLASCADFAGELDRPEIADALSALVRHSAESSPEVLCQDFNDLFMVPGKKYVAPYESVYRDARILANGKAKARTYGPSTQAVMAFYRRVGLRIASHYMELPDYVGLELACMEYLCSREADCVAARDASWQKVRALEAEFLKDHLLQWLPGLADRVHEKAETAYHKAKADLALSWVKREAGALCSRI